MEIKPGNPAYETDSDRFFRMVVGLWLRRLIGGILLAGAACWYGVSLIQSHHAVIPNIRTWHGMLTLDGMPALMLGVAIVALGGFWHCHYCWRGVPKIAKFFEHCKVLMLMVTVALLGYVLWIVLS